MTNAQRDIIRKAANLVYPDFVMFLPTSEDVQIILIDREIPFTDTHTLIDHLRRELAQWHATTQRELWQIIEPEVRAQIAEIVGIESDGY